MIIVYLFRYACLNSTAHEHIRPSAGVISQVTDTPGDTLNRVTGPQHRAPRRPQRRTVSGEADRPRAAGALRVCHALPDSRPAEADRNRQRSSACSRSRHHGLHWQHGERRNTRGRRTGGRRPSCGGGTERRTCSVEDCRPP